MARPRTRLRTLIVGVDPDAQHLLLRQFALLDLGAAEICPDAEATPDLVRADPRRFDILMLRLKTPATTTRDILHRLASLHFAGRILFTCDGPSGRVQTALQSARMLGLHVLGSIRSPTQSLSRLRALYARIDTARPRQGGDIYGPGRLLRAINQGELCSHYQPKVMFDSGRVIGVEALARWRHPDDGLLTPEVFLPLAERESLAADLARTLLRHQLRDLRDWRDAGIDLSLSFNTAGTDPAAPELPTIIAADAAADTGPRLRLIREVSEAQLSETARRARAVAQRLHRQHVGLAIDNFGSGDVPTSSLRRLPIDELKIDRAFVHGAAFDPTLRTIVETGLHIARELGVRSVAEGVETRADWDLLRALGCDAAQGYFVAPPLPADEIPAWITRWHQHSRDLVSAAAHPSH